MAVSKKSLENLKKGEATQFSSEKQPPPGTNGRKPSLWGRYLKNEGIELRDIKLLLSNIFGYTNDDIKEFLKDKENRPPIALEIIFGALSDDLQKKSLYNLEKLWDRTYGRPTQKDIIEFAEIPDTAKDRLSRIFGDAQAKSAKIKPKTVSEKNTGKKQEKRGEGLNEE
jgi:hypothetical protein